MRSFAIGIDQGSDCIERAVWSLIYTSHLFSQAFTFPKQALFFTYKSFENTMRKGEIARNEQFLLYPMCFLSV